MPQPLAITIATTAKRLEGVTETPRLDAELLVAHILDLPRSRMLAKLHETLEVPDLEVLVERRLNYEPIAYITGSWEFFGLELSVHAPILVPRPETEHLVETALEYLTHRALPNPRILDLCTGTGCIPIAIAKNCTVTVTVTDINPDAITLTRENAARHNLNIITHLGDLFDALPADTPPFDLITCNPPYVEVGEWEALSPAITRHEDPCALLSGGDGLDCMRRLITQAPKWLNPGGMLAVEMDTTQRGAVESLFQQAGFAKVRASNDLSGRPRIIFGLFPG